MWTLLKTVLFVVLEVAFPVAVLVSGIVLLIISSDKAVEHSVYLASALGISSLMIGLVLASIGTDLPEIANSIISCWSGHGDIDLGDSIGSVLAQITLVFGLIAFFGREFRVKRKEVLWIGAFEVIALVLVVLVALTGFTRVKALLLIASWPVFIFIIRRFVKKEIADIGRVVPRKERHYLHHLVIAILGFAGVGIGALAVVQSIIMLSNRLNIPEFFISFFVLGIGTSVPEFVIDLTAIRKRQYELAVGDILGSCIVDATISPAIGQLLFPTPVFIEAAGRAIRLALYTILASTVVTFTLTLREKVDRKLGALFIIIYLISYLLVYVT